MNVWRLLALAGAMAVATAACGGGDGPSGGPTELVEDSAVLTACTPELPGAGQARAKRVACADELPTGMLVAGRIGDILLENERVKVVIRGFGEGYTFPGTHAGGIIDAALHGSDDLVRELFTFVEFNAIAAEQIVITEAGDDGVPSVVVRGPGAPVPLLAAALNTPAFPSLIETTYRLAPGETSVTVSTKLYALEGNDARPTGQVGDIFFFGGAAETWMPGTGAVSGAAAGEAIASRGTTSSYGFSYPASVNAVQLLNVQNLTAALGPQRTVGNEEPIVRHLVIGDGSVDSVLDQAHQLRGNSVGTVVGTTASGVEVEFLDSNDRPVTLCRADLAGAYGCDLLPGAYRARAVSTERAIGALTPVTVVGGEQVTADVAAGASGTLIIQAKDDTQTPLPARVSVRSEEAVRYLYTDVSGRLEVKLPPGPYDIDVTRGMEYDAFSASSTLISNAETTTLDATLTRVIDTSGWVAIDTHIHSEMSIDSSVPLLVRVASIAAEGIEVAISTDHDFVTDYGPYVDALGLGAWLRYRAGVETTSLMWGHTNAWPLTPDYDRGGGGAFSWYGKPPGEVWDLMRDEGSHVVVQLNHPRLSPADLFNFIDYSPLTGAAGQDPESVGFPGADLNDFDFDVMEVANDISDGEFMQVFRDWLGLVSFGHPVGATGSSDSHEQKRFIGKSRTYVYVGDGLDTIADIDLAAVDSALRARKAVVAQGAFVTAAIIDPVSTMPVALGDIASLQTATELRIKIKVQAAAWMPLSAIRIFVGPELATTINLDANDTATIRYDGEAVLPLGAVDDFVVVVVDPAGEGVPVINDPGPSFTNPLLFDRDGDGMWTPRMRP